MATQTYTVLPGDSLSAISKKFFGDFSMTSAIATLNNITNQDLIHPGQYLKIPDVEEAVVIGDNEETAAKKKNTWILILVAAAGLGAGYMYYKTKKKKALAGVPKTKKKKRNSK